MNLVLAAHNPAYPQLSLGEKFCFQIASNSKTTNLYTIAQSI